MNSISRREFLRVSALVGAASVAAACVPTAPTPAAQPTAAPSEAPAQPTPAPAVPMAPPATPAPVSRYNEAPTLAEMVARGELPPVDDRLPENPYVVEGLDGIGNYGGTWRLQKRGQADGTARYQVVTRGLLNVDHTLALKSYMAEAYDASPDATEWTFHLRRGIKWSDGEPLTTEDVRFWYEDLILNREYTAAHPRWLASVVDGQIVPAELQVMDGYTFAFRFQLPNGLFPFQTAIVLNAGGVMAPAHFLKQFHPDYGDKAAIDALIAGNDSWDDWTQVMTDKSNSNLTPERPTHEPWVNLNVFSDEILTLSRNPYFWEVDTAGNQLPYIDTVQFRDFTDPEVAILRAVNGETDCQARHLGFASYTVFKEGEARGDYYTQLWRRTAVIAICFNSTTKDQRLAELFAERDFRIAVSLGVNRDEMRELLLDGFGTNMQYVPPPESPFHSEKLATAYIEYDADRANALLDGLGYTERDAEGYRVFKDGTGERIRFTGVGTNPDTSDSDLLVIDYLRALGLEMNYRGMDRALFIELCNTNEVEVIPSTSADRTLLPVADPIEWVKTDGPGQRPLYATYQAWYRDPTDPIAVEPPAVHYCRKLWDLNDALQRAVGEEAQKQVWSQIMDIWAEELPMPGFYGDFPQPVVVKNGFKGIHEGYPYDCCQTIYEHIIDNATWYWDEPDKHTAP